MRIAGADQRPLCRDVCAHPCDSFKIGLAINPDACRTLCHPGDDMSRSETCVALAAEAPISMPDVPIERADVVALLFNVSDIAITLAKRRTTPGRGRWRRSD